jgi:hypothetical protein
MTKQDPRRVPPRSDRLHPVVWRTILLLALWTVIAAWGFVGRGYTDYVLVVVSGFVLAAVGLPALLWLNWSRNRTGTGRAETGAAGSFRDWLAGEVEIRRGRIKGVDAAFAVLLPIAAVALGMTAFAIVLNLTVRGGS